MLDFITAGESESVIYYCMRLRFLKSWEKGLLAQHSPDLHVEDDNSPEPNQHNQKAHPPAKYTISDKLYDLTKSHSKKNDENSYS